MGRLIFSRKFSKFEYQKADDIKVRSEDLIKKLHLDHLQLDRLFYFRSNGSKARAYARTWCMPKIMIHALEIKPAYVIEVISKYYDKLPSREQDKVLLHELTHIPKNFSGALVPHTRRRKGSFKNKLEELVQQYMRNNSL